MLQNIKIRAMLFILIGIMLTLFISIGTLSLLGLNRTSHHLNTLYNDRLIPIEELSKINDHLQISIQQLLMAQFHDPRLQENSQRKSDHLITKHTDIAEGFIQKDNKIWEKYLKTYLTPKEKVLAEKFHSSLQKYRNEGQAPAIALIKQKQFLQLSKHNYSKLLPLYNEAEHYIAALIQLQLDVGKEEKEKAYANGEFTKNLTIISIIGGMLLALGISFLIIRKITRNLTESVTIMSSSATEIAATATQHETTVLNQTSLVSETTATVEELRVSAQTSSNQAENSASVIKKTKQLAEEGSLTSQRASEGMGELQEKVRAVAEQILQLSEQAGQIGVIAKVVGDLASETNMLALNAAVEAARAGENGKGFAVVASEVRKLADQSKKSAESANALVADIQKATNSAVMVAEEGNKTAEEVYNISMQNNETFHALAEYSVTIDQNAQQVVLNSQQQVIALSQISDAMNSLNAGSTEMATGTKQTKVGLQNLADVATALKAMI